MYCANSATAQLITCRETADDQWTRKERERKERRHDNRQNNCQQEQWNDQRDISRTWTRGTRCALYLSWLSSPVELCACFRCMCFLPWRTAGLPVTARYEDFRGKADPVGLHPPLKDHFHTWTSLHRLDQRLALKKYVSFLPTNHPSFFLRKSSRARCACCRPEGVVRKSRKNLIRPYEELDTTRVDVVSGKTSRVESHNKLF